MAFADDIIFYIENTKEITEKKSKPNKEFSYVSKYQLKYINKSIAS